MEYNYDFKRQSEHTHRVVFVVKFRDRSYPIEIEIYTNNPNRDSVNEYLVNGVINNNAGRDVDTVVTGVIRFVSVDSDDADNEIIDSVLNK